jgi:lysine 6-dehydrogenase
MRYLLLGAGRQGTAIAHDLLRNVSDTAKLTVVDRDAALLARLGQRLAGDPRLETVAADIGDTGAVASLMRAASTVISAVPYWFNAELAASAIAGRAHFMDLGGNNDVVRKQLALDAQARRRSVTIIPDCGLAPGLAGILACHLHAGLERCETLRIRVGGLPQRPRPPLHYSLSFSVEGLINEYVEPALVVRNGREQTVPSLTEVETVRFPAPYGELEAFLTSGGVSTLPQTLAGRVRHLDYKTIRYKGHGEKMRLLGDLGCFSSRPLALAGGEVAPRALTARLLEAILPHDEPDVVLLLIEAEGTTRRQPSRRTLRIIDTYDQTNGLSAMARMTGFPAAIIARLLAAGAIAETGAKPQETVVPTEIMIRELAARGVTIEEREEPPAGDGPDTSAAGNAGARE